MGTTISHYKILEKLGGGGMGVVYRAEDTKLKRTVALKFLPPELTCDEKAKERFIHEAQAASALQHDHICTIHDIDETDDGQLFIVMDLYEGETLKKRIEHGPLKIDEVIDIAIQIAQGLTKAHEHGIVHRDIKPANVLITRDGVAKIVDFGLAKLTGRTILTKSGTTVGTAAYMSPEQARGEHVDQRTDIWSLGIVLYEMLTGKRPFESEYEQALVYSILNEDPKPVRELRPEVPEAIEKICRWAIAKDPKDRYQTASEVITDLESYKAGTQLSQQTRRVLSKERGLLYASGAVVTILLCIAIFFLLTRSTPIESIAVLPLENVGGDPNTEYLSDGITEGIINKLTQLSHLRVAPRPTVFSYKGKLGDPLKTGRELNVRAVFTGKLTRRGEKYIVQADLIDVREESQLLGEQYNIATSAIPSLSRDISQKIVERLRVELSSKEQKELGKVPTENSEAYKYYLRGNNYAARFTESSLRAAIDEYQKALSFDSSYALAYCGISNAYLLLGNAYLVPAREAWQRSTEAAYRALRFDSTIVEASLNLADASFWWEWNWQQAKTQYEQVIHMEPGNFAAHRRLAQLLVLLSRPDEAVEEALQAEKIDPMMEETSTVVGWMFYFRREYEKAISYYQKTLAHHPQYYRARRLLGTACLLTKRNAEAIQEIAKAVDFSNESTEEKAYLAYAFAVIGEKEKAQRELTAILALAKQKIVPSYLLALVYTGLGDKDQAFHYLDKAYDERAANMVFLKIEPLFDRLRSDPRFAVLLKKMGLDI